jgi:hypothetical protein
VLHGADGYIPFVVTSFYYSGPDAARTVEIDGRPAPVTAGSGLTVGPRPD